MRERCRRGKMMEWCRGKKEEVIWSDGDRAEGESSRSV